MKTIYLRTRSEWRDWLEQNGTREKEIWLIYYKKHSGKLRIPYEDAVQEALCFGWIDGVIKRLDEDRYVQKFTSRNPKSRWSALNIKRARKLIDDGLMRASGLKVFKPDRRIEAKPTELPEELETEFRKNKAAWKNFENFPPYYRRMTVSWVASAKKNETRLKRLNQLITSSAQNKQIKFI
jgi:uncharacterized protein YdeI (YjbR/CyaY-like superfamily)